MVRGERDRAVGEGKSLRQTITALEQDKQVWKERREGEGERGKKGSRGGWRKGERKGRTRRQTRSHISLTSLLLRTGLGSQGAGSCGGNQSPEAFLATPAAKLSLQRRGQQETHCFQIVPT